MAYQPNPFERGLELPAGCKDLYEVLEKSSAAPGASSSILPVERGGLKDVPRHVEHVYGQAYGWSLVIRIFGQGPVLVLWVHNRYGGPTLTFPLRKVGAPEEGGDGVKMISVPLPHLWLEAAQTVETVIRGYGMPNTGEFFFQFFEG